jgi:phosphoribosylcarboxyaminoimidazole (NCAIR) mutase
VRAPNPIGALFAEAARLEAASIPAFRLLARELSAHRAPAALVRAARSAARDEVRHARATAALARRYRAAPARPTLGNPPRRRSLEAIAIENAVEGCVRETYGALVALWQARRAKDPVVAAAMAPIAADETRHAELAWRVAAWAAPRLSRASRRRVDAARARAFADLRAEATRPVPAAQVALAGLPSAETAARLLEALEATCSQWKPDPHLPRSNGGA